MPGLFAKLLSLGSDKELKEFQGIVERINGLEPRFSGMDDEELAACTVRFRERLDAGESLDDLLPEAFAAVREASSRAVGMRHFDVQLMGGIALHRGMIAEMKTGEGKTLVSTLAGYLNALSGRGVHIVTVNDYLARRDCEWMGAIYERMGMSAGRIQNGMRPEQRIPAYQADVTYGTNSEFGFDYLRDNMVRRPERRVQRGHAYAIVDEVDSILIDEARTPLIISGVGTRSAETYRDFARAVKGLVPERDFEMDEAKHTIAATEEGLAKVERRLGRDIYEDMSGQLVNHLQQALRAEYMYHLDQQYVKVNGEIKIVDEFTGRIMEGRRYSEGLHQAIEAKERVAVREENQTLATVTLQNYFLLYDKLAGMTGTALTEDAEFRQIYHLDVQPIPPNKPVIREDLDDLVYRTIDAKFEAVADDVERRHAAGQPCLVGTVSIESSERLSSILRHRGIPHEVLNAKQHEREAQIVAQAGRKGAVTIATNMAGRGTDIVLGGNPEALARDSLVQRGIDPDEATEEQRAEALARAEETCAAERRHVVEVGGLAVIGTERHESRRIDNQLRGRSGRQGDPGVTQFYLSFEDDLMRLFAGDRLDALASLMERLNIPEDQPIRHKQVSKAVEYAQRKVEQVNFARRKNVLDYDNVMDVQRRAIYEERNRILDGKDVTEHLVGVIGDVAEAARRRFCPADAAPSEWDLAGLRSWLAQLTGADELPEPEEGASSDDVRDLVASFVRERYDAKVAEIGDEEGLRSFATQVMLSVMDVRWMGYLQEMDYLKAGVNLRAFGQRDPLSEYKTEAYAAFTALRDAMYADFVRSMLHVRRREEPDRSEDLLDRATYQAPAEVDGDQADSAVRQRAASAPRVAAGQGAPKAVAPRKVQTVRKDKDDPFANVGRNDDCPCGSGRKYKKCCGSKRR